MKFSHLTAAVFVVSLVAIATFQMRQLEDRNNSLEQQLRESLIRQTLACQPQEPVMVTCVCPEYDEGWDDAEYVSGCSPEEIDLETLQGMCSELEAFGYVPHC